MTTDIVDRLRDWADETYVLQDGELPAVRGDLAAAADEIERLRAREDELCSICAEAYQVVGSMLSDLGQFGTGIGDKVLDNLSQHKRIHDDVIPWPSFEHPRAADEIERLRGLLRIADGKLEALTGEPHIDGWPLHSGLPPGPSAAASGLQPERSDRMDKD